MIVEKNQSTRPEIEFHFVPIRVFMCMYIRQRGSSLYKSPPRVYSEVEPFTFIIGPCVGTGDGDPWCDEAFDTRGLNAAMLCDTPSARMNCSRSSMFVRPLAEHTHDEDGRDLQMVVVVGSGQNQNNR